MSHRFADWGETQEIVSTFRARHPTQQRFAYERARTRSALDDIYIGREHGSILTESGIWLNSLQTSDHAGTPFAVLHFRHGGGVPRELKGVKTIRTVNTRVLAAEELELFTERISAFLQDDKLSRIDDIITE